MNSINIGFDGGGSVSRFRIQRCSDEPYTRTFHLNLKFSDIGIEQSAAGFVGCLMEILPEDLHNLRAMCIAISGGSDPKLNVKFMGALRNQLKRPDLLLHVESDSSFTIETAYPDSRSGLLLIAGTGSVAVAKTRDAEIVKVGGWGRLLGDEGSGYWIGLQALKHYCKVIDGAENKGELFGRIGERLQDSNQSARSFLRNKLHFGELRPQDFATLVFESLEVDPSAEEILLDAAANLMIDLETLWKKVEGSAEPEVTLHGSIARQPFIFNYIQENCQVYGLRCNVLDEQSVLERTLEVSRKLE